MDTIEFAEGLILIKTEILKDNRGLFNVVFKDLKFDLVQLNQSVSKENVLRGLHYQESPYEQSKIVWVSKGAIMDVVVDLRRESGTFGQSFKFLLSEGNRNTLLIPRGFAHGFKCLEDDTVVNYAVDNVYSPEAENSIHPFDKDLNIDWEIDPLEANMSARDILGQSFQKFKNKTYGI
jgi:dTDP-4-dehydrorhamnose 3,5-epimerase